MRVLVTGAAGEIGRALRLGLKDRYDLLRLTDMRAMPAADAGEDVRVADLTDPEAAARMAEGIDCIVHFAGLPREAGWEAIVPHNIVATVNVFEAARRHRVRRIVYASTNHVTGYYRADRSVTPADTPRPDSRYAVSKVFGEALGRLYADKHGVSVACLRIGSFRDRPRTARELRTWISPRDTVQLVRRCIESDAFHFVVLYGVSANRRANWHDAHAAALGYVPEDDAEEHAGAIALPAEDDLVADAFHGGPNCALEFEGDMARID